MLELGLLVGFRRIRITEWLVSEGTFKDHLLQPPCHGQGHLSLDQVAQSSIQPNPEHFQRIHNFFGQPVPVSHHPHEKNFLLMSSLNLSSFGLKMLPFVLSL